MPKVSRTTASHSVELQEFSPTDVLEKTIKVVMSNLQRVGAS